MKQISGRKHITGFLTLFCILLLSTNAMAAESTGSNQNADSMQTESVGTKNNTINHTENVATASDAMKVTDEIGPGIEKKEPPAPKETGPVYNQGQSLGLFTATAYCPNGRSGRQSRTYSGTIPKPMHTLSADISILPLGSKVMIDGIVYTVEDIGSSVKGNKIDIFFGSRSEALAFGRQTKELFAVVEE
ncbi:3D domain-containing protein [Clostridium sp. E02]|uniref:3D domain-containing protein n=1 Tax=Clostridium sp. E02 TaxID=2487134 RepID=UPI0013DE6A9B|nr:3D domain-containing protein [Clostridium sp. E02]